MNLLIKCNAIVLLLAFGSCAPKQQSNNLSTNSEAEQPEMLSANADQSETRILDTPLEESQINAPESTKKEAEQDGFVVGQIHIKLKKGQVSTLQSYDVQKEQLGKHPQLQELIDRYKIKSIKPAFAGLNSNIYILSFDESIKADKIMKAAQAYEFVEYAEQIPLNK